MLRGNQSTVEFRHELAWRAILETLTLSERTELHHRALIALQQRLPDIAAGELARHAIEAGDAEAVLDLAPRAGAEAALLGAHQAALAYYTSALEYAGRLAGPARASLFEAHAHECFVTDNVPDAVASQEKAFACLQQPDDSKAQGRALADLAEYLWWHGESDRAQDLATEAVELLESNRSDATVARAYANLAGILMRSGRHAKAMVWARRALCLAEEFGEEAVAVHSLNTLGVSQVCTADDEGWDNLQESLRRAGAADLEEDTARALNNLIASTHEHRLYDLFDRYSQQAATFFDEHDLDASEMCLNGDIAEAMLERGRWAEAETSARLVIDRGTIHGRIQCLAVLGRLAARRGDDDPFPLLDEALELQGGFGGEAMYPLRPARAEAAWLAGDVRRAAREISLGLSIFDEKSNPWLVGEAALWAHKTGVEWDCPVTPSEPYAFYLDGHPDKAAAAWAALGCPYDEAEALTEAGDEEDVHRALAIFRSLGAARDVKVVTDRLKASGARRISRGPRRSTSANPSGLSEREVEVLTLLAAGLRNAEIASRLFVSTRTVDHHVSAILAKLDVRSRYDAGQKALALGLAPAAPDADPQAG
jgi:DNA-binding CsgD family transcriptional regulator